MKIISDAVGVFHLAPQDDTPVAVFPSRTHLHEVQTREGLRTLLAHTRLYNISQEASRRTNDKWCEKRKALYGKFELEGFGIPTLIYHEYEDGHPAKGKYTIVNGYGRIFSFLEEIPLPMQVEVVVSRSPQQTNRIWRARNTQRGSTNAQINRANIEAQDEYTMELKSIADRYGYTVAHQAGRTGDTSIATMEMVQKSSVTFDQFFQALNGAKKEEGKHRVGAQTSIFEFLEETVDNGLSIDKAVEIVQKTNLGPYAATGKGQAEMKKLLRTNMRKKKISP